MQGTFQCMATLTLDWVQLAAIVGALQGLILTGVLIAQRSNRTANRLLAALTLSFTVYLAWGPYYTAGIIRVFPHLFGISYLTPWTFGPLVYLYARAASDSSWRFTRGALPHFVLPAIVFIAVLPLFFLSGHEKIAMWERWSQEGLHQPLRSIDPLKYVSGIVYSVATVLLLRRHRRDIEESYSNLERVNLRWLLWLSAATGGIWLLATGLRISHVSIVLRDAQITFAMSLLVYGIGYMGLRQPEIFRFRAAEPSEAKSPASQPSVPAQPLAQPERSRLSDHEVLLVKTALLAIMDREQPWRNPELTLSDLAARLDTTPHKLSEVLNAQLGRSFYDFVNSYRVREVQRRIRAGDARSLKMLALAMDAGFASKSTFNEAFKKHTSQTPSGYRQTVGA